MITKVTALQTAELAHAVTGLQDAETVKTRHCVVVQCIVKDADRSLG